MEPKFKIGDTVWHFIWTKENHTIFVIKCTVEKIFGENKGWTENFYDIDEPIGHSIPEDKLVSGYDYNNEILYDLLQNLDDDIEEDIELLSDISSIEFNKADLNEWRQRNIKSLMSAWSEDMKKEYNNVFPIEYRDKIVGQDYFSISIKNKD